MAPMDAILDGPGFANLRDTYDSIKLLGRVLQQPHVLSHDRRGMNGRSLSPVFDLRETPTAYFLEGEFPGISGRSAIKLQWLNGRTLRVEGNVDKLDLGDEWESKGDVVKGEQSGGDEMSPSRQVVSAEVPIMPINGSVAKREGNALGSGNSTLGWLNERRDGLYTRSFHFPAAVEAGSTQARLVQGLLRIKIPKVETSMVPKVVDIEVAGEA